MIITVTGRPKNIQKMFPALKKQIGPGNTWPIYPINIMGQAGTYFKIFFAVYEDSLQIVQLAFFILFYINLMRSYFKIKS